MQKNYVKVEGFVRLQVKDNVKGIVKDTGFKQNGITNGAFAVFSGLVGNTGAQTAAGWLAVGTDATAFSASQTALIAEIVDTGLARHSATVSRITTTQTNDTLQLTYTWTASGSKTINEVGVFNASSSGVMIGRLLTGAIAITTGQSLIATYTIKFS